MKTLLISSLDIQIALTVFAILFAASMVTLILATGPKLEKQSKS